MGHLRPELRTVAGMCIQVPPTYCGLPFQNGKVLVYFTSLSNDPDLSEKSRRSMTLYSVSRHSVESLCAGYGFLLSSKKARTRLPMLPGTKKLHHACHDFQAYARRYEMPALQGQAAVYFLAAFTYISSSTGTQMSMPLSSRTYAHAVRNAQPFKHTYVHIRHEVLLLMSSLI